MGSQRKSWIEKLKDAKGLPKVVSIKKSQEKKWGKGTMAIPSPMEVDKVIRRVPYGRVILINQIRQRIAKRHKATIACPITTGIFSWIAAYAAEEMRMAGRVDISPWWRVLKGDGFLNEKFPGGAEHQKSLLEGEGHSIIRKGKKYLVADVEETQLK